MSIEELQQIVENNQLQNYIVGTVPFLTARIEDDYYRWLKVKKYYENLSTNHKHRVYIESVILDLCEKNDNKNKHIGLITGRILRLPAVSKKIIDLIKDEKFNDLDNKIKDEIGFSIAMLQITEVGIFAAKYFLYQNRLKEFIFSNSNFKDIAKEDFFWIFNVIHNLYDISEKKEKDLIYKDILESTKDDPNFGQILESYLSAVEVKSEFTDLMKNFLNQTDL